jgi:hypothetical protein
MITYYLTLIGLGALQAVIYPITLLPDVSLPATLVVSISAAGNYMSILNLVLPISTLFTIFTTYIGIELGIFTYKLIKWIYNKIPGIN